MAIQVKEVPYEIMIRLTNAGEIAGMHYRKLALVFDDEIQQVLSATELGPFPLTAEGNGEFTYAAVLGQALVAANCTIVSLTAEVERLKQEN